MQPTTAPTSAPQKACAKWVETKEELLPLEKEAAWIGLALADKPGALGHGFPSRQLTAELLEPLAHRILLPQQLARHTRADAIRLHPVPVIVKAKHRSIILRDKLPLELICWVVLQLLRRIQVLPERRLVCHDHVSPHRDCTLYHLKRRHHRRRNPLHPHRRRAGNNPVHRLRHPRNPHPALDALNHLAGRQSAPA